MENYPLECIIGIPSGQVINITKREWNALHNLALIKWDSELSEITFNDMNIKTIDRFINAIYEDDIIETSIGRRGRVDKIIRYNGDKINGIDYSNIYKKGDILYLINFKHGNKGLYKKDVIKKIRVPNEILESVSPKKQLLLTKGNYKKDSSKLDLIGIPSGQIIEITYDEIGPLKRAGLIKWRHIDNQIGSYTFKDVDFKNLIEFLYTLQ